MQTARLILSAALAASALVGIEILLTDYWLWSALPTHAYGLIVFVVVDAVLLLGTLRAVYPVVFGALLTATIELVSMLGDIVMGQPSGTPAAAFRSYLLGDTAYLGLLVTQCLILAMAAGTWALPRFHRHLLATLKIVKQ